MSPLQRTTQAFAAAFGARTALSVRAPGRVNLIGEHTDYNDGLVLPCAIDFHTVASGSPRHEGCVRVIAVDCAGESDEFTLGAPIEPAGTARWPNCVRVVLKHLVEAECAPGGADLAIGGDVPQGAGRSSSASLVVAVGEFFRSLHNLAIDALVDIVKDALGEAGGVRMTGGGFGGSVVALVPGALVARVGEAVASRYRAASGLDASIHVCHASAGTGVC